MSGACAFRHAKRIWNSDIVLAFASFWYHILLVHQGLLETALEAPLDVLRVLICEPLRLGPRRVDISDSEPRENHLLPRSQLAPPREVHHEGVPGDAILLVLLGDAHE